MSSAKDSCCQSRSGGLDTCLPLSRFSFQGDDVIFSARQSCGNSSCGLPVPGYHPTCWVCSLPFSVNRFDS